MGFELRQRIARPFGVERFFRLVGLRVLEGVAFEARHRQAQQRRAVAAAHVCDRFGDQLGRFRGVCAVAVEHVQAGEAGEILGDVAARRLEARQASEMP